MAAKRSAGLLVFRRASASRVEVLLAHMGGPYWAGRDAGAWSIPKGEPDPGEPPLQAARREFREELGREPPAGEPIDLGEVRQASGKLIRAWAIEGDLDVSAISSNTFQLEWPPRSGHIHDFPEIDRADWFDLPAARTRLVKGQVCLIDLLAEHLGIGESRPPAPRPGAREDQAAGEPRP